MASKEGESSSGSSTDSIDRDVLGRHESRSLSSQPEVNFETVIISSDSSQRTTNPNRNSNALDREVIATLSALRSWMKKDDIKTTPQETCGHAYGTVLGTFLAKLPLDKQYGAFNELMAVAKRHIAEGMAASSVGQPPLIHQDASRPQNVSEESPIMQSPERQPSPIDSNVEHLATGDHGTSAFHVPNLHDYSLNSTMQVPDLSAQQSPPSRPTSPPIYTQL